MSTKIYVGNLSFKAMENDLEDLFAQYGEVSSVRIITDRQTNRSKGFGFVEMGDASAATAAISALNEKEWMDRKIVVNEARDREERPRNNYR
jgi:RNA recognition motif-containing protein